MLIIRGFISTKLDSMVICSHRMLVQHKSCHICFHLDTYKSPEWVNSLYLQGHPCTSHRSRRRRNVCSIPLGDSCPSQSRLPLFHQHHHISVFTSWCPLPLTLIHTQISFVLLEGPIIAQFNRRILCGTYLQEVLAALRETAKVVATL